MLRRWRLYRPAAPSCGPMAAVGLVLLFGGMGLVTRLLCADADGYSSFWMANAAMLVAVLVLRTRLAAVVVVTCFGVNLCLNRISGLSSSECVLTSVMNVIQVMLVAFPTRRFCGARTDLSRLRRQSTFGLIAFVGSAIEAAIGVGIEACFLGDTHNIFDNWLQWVLCDALGLVLTTPTVLMLMREAHVHARRPAITLKPMMRMLGTILLTIVSFMLPHSFLFFFLYPAMVTLAFRARPAWALGTVLVVSIVVSAFTVHDLGPIALISPHDPLLRQNLLQPFLWSLFLSALPANNVLGEQRRSAHRLVQMKAHLEHAATHDPLTGLLTRQPFKRRLSARLRSGAGGTLLFIDLDHFKQVNDTHGHQAGDRVLQMFGERMAACARTFGGEAARFGGDEFAMYLPGKPDGVAPDAMVASVLETARRPYHLGYETACLSVSIGGVSLDARIRDADELILRADEALYAAKNAGRDDYRLHDEPAFRNGTITSYGG